MESCPVQPQSSAYHSAAIWGVKCLAQGHHKVVLKEEDKVSCQVFYPDAKRQRKERHFAQETERDA